MVSRQFPASETRPPCSESKPSVDGDVTCHRNAYPRWLKDIAIRCGGMMLLVLSAIAFTWLYRLIHAAPRSEGTLAQYAIAAVGFLCASIGLGLAALGYSIHDPVAVSDRWRSRI